MVELASTSSWFSTVRRMGWASLIISSPRFISHLPFFASMMRQRKSGTTGGTIKGGLWHILALPSHMMQCIGIWMWTWLLCLFSSQSHCSTMIHQSLIFALSQRIQIMMMIIYDVHSNGPAYSNSLVYDGLRLCCFKAITFNGASHPLPNFF